MTRSKGYIHSIDTFSTVDGPGTRYVVFFQGCPLRCLYCHNPDTWKFGIGNQMTVEEILSGYEKNRHYYTKGGITASGGEALGQLDFLTELFRECKKRDIHTALDTSGIFFDESIIDKFDELMKYTDLVLLDIKHIDEKKHLFITSAKLEKPILFSKYLDFKGIPMIIRHVVVPGINDQEEDLYNLGYFLGGFRNVQSIEVLGYHTLGVHKYEQLGIDYKLKDVPNLPKEKAVRARETILKGLKDRRALYSL